MGGISWAWGSPQSVGLAVAGVVLTVAFLLAERRAKEPVIPLRLFTIRVFSSASAIGFVMGFAMFGALTFLPLFLQNVKLVSPTSSGLRILPLMGGMLAAAILSGRLVTRWGRYKVFPIVGTALMTIGAYLMSLIGEHTGAWVMAGYMFIFGVGLGLIMQVLRWWPGRTRCRSQDLGVATSSATFFRMIGGVFGSAVFGAIFANTFSHNLLSGLQRLTGAHITSLPAGATALDPSSLRHLQKTDPAVYALVLKTITHSVETVFLFAVPIAFFAFLLSWLLPELELRKTVQTVDTGETFGQPQVRSSLDEIQLALERFSARENREELYQTLANRAGIALPPRAAGCSTGWPTDRRRRCTSWQAG